VQAFWAVGSPATANVLIISHILPLKFNGVYDNRNSKLTVEKLSGVDPHSCLRADSPMR